MCETKDGALLLRIFSFMVYDIGNQESIWCSIELDCVQIASIQKPNTDFATMYYRLVFNTIRKT